MNKLKKLSKLSQNQVIKKNKFFFRNITCLNGVYIILDNNVRNKYVLNKISNEYGMMYENTEFDVKKFINMITSKIIFFKKIFYSLIKIKKNITKSLMRKIIIIVNMFNKTNSENLMFNRFMNVLSYK